MLRYVYRPGRVLDKGGTGDEEQTHADDCDRDGTRQCLGRQRPVRPGRPGQVHPEGAGWARVLGNCQPCPDGSRMAKIHWSPTKMATFPAATVPGTLHDVDFMVKDSNRFADSGGWGWAVFEYEAASRTFRPGTSAAAPRQGRAATCGFACHTFVKPRDDVFTDYGSS